MSNKLVHKSNIDLDYNEITSKLQLNDADLSVLTGMIPDALMFLVKGYLSYASDVILERAIPNIDGFKPSQRRILDAMKFIGNMGKGIVHLTKCQSVVGDVMKIHPHGDSSIYDALVRMVDSTEMQNVPFIKGHGSFGIGYTTDTAAAPRYTECMFTPIAEELFKDIAGATWIQSYDDNLEEVELLPVTFPNILINANQGIAVGMASNIPSFNFNETLLATIELIETGEILKPLVPDYKSKGYVVQDDEAFKALMYSGRAKVKLRGKWHVEEKSIIIDEVPYYTTVQAIMKDIAEIKGITDIRDECDLKGLRLAIDCASKKVVEEVLLEVLKVSKLQMDIVTNMVVICDNAPKKLGVVGVLQNWIEFRSKVVNKKLKAELDGLNKTLNRYTLFVDLTDDEEKLAIFIGFLKTNVAKAKQFLRDTYANVTADDTEWLINQSLRAFYDTKSKKKQLLSLKESIKDTENDLKDVKKVIVRELKVLNETYKYPRQSVISTTSYNFEKNDVVVKAEATSVYVTVNNKFIRKVRSDRFSEVAKEPNTIACLSDDTISCIDSQGRLLRINLETLDFVGSSDRGTYIPKLLDLLDDFDIKAFNKLDEHTRGYLYSDGFVSVVDYTEWMDVKRRTKITYKGVSESANLLVCELDLSKDYTLLVTKEGKLGFIENNFKRKCRTGRTRVLQIKDTDIITVCIGINYNDMLSLVSAPDKHLNRLSLLAEGTKFNTDLYTSLVNKN